MIYADYFNAESDVYVYDSLGGIAVRFAVNRFKPDHVFPEPRIETQPLDESLWWAKEDPKVFARTGERCVPEGEELDPEFLLAPEEAIELLQEAKARGYLVPDSCFELLGGN